MSKSKSNSEANQSSNTTDNRVVADGEAIVATGGSTINYMSDDVANTALETAARLGESSLALSGDIVAGGYDLTREVSDRLAAVTEASRIDNNNFARDLANSAIAKIEQNARSVDAQVLGVVGKYAAWISGAIAAALVLWGFVTRRK